MKIYAMGENGKLFTIGDAVLMTEPHNGRRLVKGKVMRITPSYIYVSYHDMKWGVNRVTRRTEGTVVAV